MSDYGVTNQGFVLKRMDTILEEIHSDLTEDLELIPGCPELHSWIRWLRHSLDRLQTCGRQPRTVTMRNIRQLQPESTWTIQSSTAAYAGCRTNGPAIPCTVPAMTVHTFVRRR